MAKVLNPLNSTEARGRVGGIIYNTWRGIRTVKIMTGPAQPRTARQLTIRGLLTTYVRAWASLTALRRAAWNTYATEHPVSDWTGGVIRKTGANIYAALNVRLVDMGKAAISDPPAVPGPATPTNLVLTAGAGQISCAFTAAGGTDTTFDFWTQGPMSAGLQPKIERAKHKAYAPGETSPYVVTPLSPGLTTVFVRAISETTGLASPFISAQATVT